jgi:hypothetical protein
MKIINRMPPRRFSRSLAEAFPCERAYAIEHTRRSFIREAGMCVAFVMFVLVMLFGLHLVARFA